jgi:hypothetical protein
MGFAQLTHRENLRDIEACLRAVAIKLYHLGIRVHVSRSTLADANEHRHWRVYVDLAQVLIHIARPLYADEPFGVGLEETVYALDAATTDVSISLSPWAPYARSRGSFAHFPQLYTLLGSSVTRHTDQRVQRHCVQPQQSFLSRPTPGN